MDAEHCKACRLHKKDTLVDGTQQDYCYPPIMIDMIAFSVPCEKRSRQDCKRILENLKNEI